MKKLIKGTFFTFILLTAPHVFAQNIGPDVEVIVTAKVSLNPIGDFVIEFNNPIKTKVEYVGENPKVNDLVLNVSKAETGIDLRNEHLRKKYLEVEKYPTITLGEIKLLNNSGEGVLTIKDKKKNVTFDYIVKSKDLIEATLKINLKDFGFDDVNYLGIGVEENVAIAVKINNKIAK